MFVRSRPSRTRWTISLSWARWDSTTKSTASPSQAPRLGRPDDGHQCSSGSDQACGPLLDVAADDIEHQIDAAGVFQRIVVEVDELLRAEVERLLTVGSASGANDVAAGLTCRAASPSTRPRRPRRARGALPPEDGRAGTVLATR